MSFVDKLIRFVLRLGIMIGVLFSFQYLIIWIFDKGTCDVVFQFLGAYWICHGTIKIMDKIDALKYKNKNEKSQTLGMS